MTVTSGEVKNPNAVAQRWADTPPKRPPFQFDLRFRLVARRQRHRLFSWRKDERHHHDRSFALAFDPIALSEASQERADLARCTQPNFRSMKCAGRQFALGQIRYGRRKDAPTLDKEQRGSEKFVGLRRPIAARSVFRLSR
ncbi:MAG: hypothetical protein C4334_02855 [Pyrinomonas sp.]